MVADMGVSLVPQKLQSQKRKQVTQRGNRLAAWKARFLDNPCDIELGKEGSEEEHAADS